MTSLKALGFAAFWLAVALLAAPVRAEAPLVTIEASGAVPLTAPQSKLFGPGGAVSAAAYYRLAPFALIGAKLRAGLLSNGSAPAAGQVDPGLGSFEMLHAMLRLRPLAKSSQVRSALGLFVEGGAGGVITGKLARASVEGGVGWGFALGSFALSPTLRYVQVVQPSDPLSSQDARLLLFGAELAVLDARPVHAASKPAVQAPPPPSDRDADGVIDADDACPDTPEDHDGFKDEDGCPDPDNDGDKILDAQDHCPNEAEDFDGFEDQDGCPDPDNDKDGFPDADDQCPNEAEVVNGNKDYDGCPDEGLIELRNDRIVLEERVLFDFERARVKSAARPVLAAIMNLYQLHPEWLKIRIEGHADQRGKEEYNQELSEQRAQNVRDSLIKLGIPADVIEAVGYGSTRPRDTRDEQAAYARNRRVEFVVVARGTVAVQAGAPGAPAASPKTEPSSGEPPPAPGGKP
jgi:outer membrane protein OmpA-like peptidoglycan-associated protein